MTRGLLRLLARDPEMQTVIVGDIILVALGAIVFVALYAFVQARVRRSLK